MRDLVVVENEPIQGLGSDDLPFLQRVLGGRLVSRRRGWAITRVVGHIVTPGGRVIRIRSAKAPTSSLLGWITYSDATLTSLRPEALVAGITDDGDLGPLLATVFSRALIAAFQHQGVSRTYLNETMRGSAVRGAIDFPRLVAEGHNLSQIPCSVWTRATDTPLNRVLAAALRRIRVDPVLREVLGPELGRVALAFGNVSDERAEPHRRQVLLSRTELAFRVAYDLALLLLRRGGLGDGTRRPGLSFIIDLERLFEQAVQRAFSESSLQPCKIRKMVMITKSTGSASEPVPMYIDVLCTTPAGALVVDAKFKREPSAADAQQITTYCVITGASHATLVLPGDAAQDFAYILRPAGTDPLTIRVVHFDTGARNTLEWRAAAADMVRRASVP